MVRLETIFAAEDSLTPEFAAKLSECAEKFESDIRIECEDKKLSINSLICILALGLYRGVKVNVFAEGKDEEEAAAKIQQVLQGKA